MVTNVRADVDVNDFKGADGVKDATKLVWGQCSLAVNGNEKSMNLLGSADMMNMVDFEFITPESKVLERVSEDKDYVFVVTLSSALRCGRRRTRLK